MLTHTQFERHRVDVVTLTRLYASRSKNAAGWNTDNNRVGKEMRDPAVMKLHKNIILPCDKRPGWSPGDQRREKDRIQR